MKNWRCYLGDVVAILMAVAIMLAAVVLAGCGRGPACPHATNDAPVRPPATCPQPMPRACAHSRRLPVPDAPLLTGYLAIDRVRLDAWQRKLELFAAMDWHACDGGSP